MPTNRRSLITLDGVRDLISRGIAFGVQYERADDDDSIPPKYRCIYLVEDEAFVLVTTRLGPSGPKPREIALWPTLFKHHREYGGGGRLCIGADWSIEVGESHKGEGARRKA